MNSENASLWDRSILPRNIEGIEAFQLFFKLPGNIKYMHPFRNLGVCFVLQKESSFFPFQPEAGAEL